MLARLMAGVGQATRRLLQPHPAVACCAERGFKVKKWVKLRCPYCYFVRVQGRLHVECHKFPKHKQREQFDVKALW